MPVIGGENYKRMPFSFRKISYQFGGLLLLGFLAATLYLMGGPLAQLSDASFYLYFIAGVFVLLTIVGLGERVAWTMLSSKLRAELPRDSSEADKGSIHSWRDLVRWMSHHS